MVSEVFGRPNQDTQTLIYFLSSGGLRRPSVMEHCFCCPVGYGSSTPPYESIPDERRALVSPVRAPYYLEESLANSTINDDENLWSEPSDVTHMEADDDRRLYNLIQRRDDEMPGSQEWMDIDIEINTTRSRRLAVRERWRRVLHELGFMEDAHTLLVVTSSSASNTLGSAQKAYQLHDELATQTSIFLEDVTQPQRYTMILDRLLGLDAAYNFIRIAKIMYPKENDDRDDETWTSSDVNDSGFQT